MKSSLFTLNEYTTPLLCNQPLFIFLTLSLNRYFSLSYDSYWLKSNIACVLLVVKWRGDVRKREDEKLISHDLV